ncbi:hypothetical protein DYB35_006565 [Aphanomyces astaci]|uniref:C2H2-type domain-containing protein n=1 Tax=Aphanomyces astaci TaxID=112090 RepID=A0A3R7ARE8_APHAT|nr:hypothetical protein DYB35_006565 [Aphanomyces astaci]
MEPVHMLTNLFDDILDWDAAFHIDDNVKPFAFPSSFGSSSHTMYVDTESPGDVKVESPTSSSRPDQSFYPHHPHVHQHPSCTRTVLQQRQSILPPSYSIVSSTQHNFALEPPSTLVSATYEPSNVLLCLPPVEDDVWWFHEFEASLRAVPPPSQPATSSPHLVLPNAEHATLLELLLSPTPPPASVPSGPSSSECVVHGCHNLTSFVRGRCKKSHDGKRRCNFHGCPSGPQTGGFCIKHGGGNRCTFVGCNKAVQTVGKCKTHGGGVRCSVAGCDRSSQGDKKCRRHGGGKRCGVDGCGKGVQKDGFCAAHHPKKSHGHRQPRRRRGGRHVDNSSNDVPPHQPTFQCGL